VAQAVKSACLASMMRPWVQTPVLPHPPPKNPSTKTSASLRISTSSLKDQKMNLTKIPQVQLFWDLMEIVLTVPIPPSTQAGSPTWFWAHCAVRRDWSEYYKAWERPRCQMWSTVSAESILLWQHSKNQEILAEPLKAGTTGQEQRGSGVVSQTHPLLLNSKPSAMPVTGLGLPSPP
jgi:hypothetical protein